MYYDKTGELITQDEWARLHADKSYVRVKEDVVGKYWISTVWLGLNHSFGDHLEIFETMVFTFNKDTNALDIDYSNLEMQRYSTEKAALAGHAEMVAKWKAKQ